MYNTEEATSTAASEKQEGANLDRDGVKEVLHYGDGDRSVEQLCRKQNGAVLAPHSKIERSNRGRYMDSREALQLNSYCDVDRKCWRMGDGRGQA